MPKTDYKTVKKQSLDNSSYMKFPQGDTKIRIVSEVFSALRHRIEIKNTIKNVVCPKTLEKNAPCPICRTGDKPKQQWVVKVLDKENKEIKILESGPMIFKQISALALNDEYGDPQKYDITVTREGEKLETEYKIVPARKNTELTVAEKELVRLDNFDLELYTTPRPESEISEILAGNPIKGDKQSVKKNDNGKPEFNVDDLPF